MHLAAIAPHIKLSLQASDNAESAVFGRGVAQLCRGVRETGSLNKAAKNMGMAYSKAWRIVKNTEEAFGVLLLERNGAHGSTLTADGERILDLYDKLQRDAARYAAQRLIELSSEYEE